MTTVKISMRGFAEVAAAKPSQKRSKLKQYKFSDSQESIGRSNYYVRAISAIKRYHHGDTDFVGATLLSLLAEAAVETEPRKKAKLLSNHRAITNYLEHFGKRKLVIRRGKQLYFVHKDVVVSAQPDLVAEEDGKLVLIKINFCKKDLAGGVVPVLLHVLFESALLNGLSVSASGVECLQTSSGSRTAGPKSGFPDRKALNSSCEELMQLWTAA